MRIFWYVDSGYKNKYRKVREITWSSQISGKHFLNSGNGNTTVRASLQQRKNGTKQSTKPDIIDLICFHHFNQFGLADDVESRNYK